MVKKFLLMEQKLLWLSKRVDVYKRQGIFIMKISASFLSSSNIPMDLKRLNETDVDYIHVDAVSYTHLDVYKRQIILVINFLSIS